MAPILKKFSPSPTPASRLVRSATTRESSIRGGLGSTHRPPLFCQQLLQSDQACRDSIRAAATLGRMGVTMSAYAASAPSWPSRASSIAGEYVLPPNVVQFPVII